MSRSAAALLTEPFVEDEPTFAEFLSGTPLARLTQWIAALDRVTRGIGLDEADDNHD